MSDIGVTFTEDDPVSVAFSEDEAVDVSFVEDTPVTVEFGSIVEGTVLPQDFLLKINILLEYDVAKNSKYTELTYVSGNITQVDIWVDAAKGVKLFTKVITYTTGNITQTVLTDEVNSKTLTKDITYDGSGNINTVTEVYA